MCVAVSLQTCWDKDRISDDFMGSLQLTRDDFGKFKVNTLINDH